MKFLRLLPLALLLLFAACVILMDLLTHGGLFKHAVWQAIRTLWGGE